MVRAEISEEDNVLEIDGEANEVCQEFAEIVGRFVYTFLMEGGYRSGSDMQHDAAQLATGFTLAVKDGYKKARKEAFGE